MRNPPEGRARVVVVVVVDDVAGVYSNGWATRVCVCVGVYWGGAKLRHQREKKTRPPLQHYTVIRVYDTVMILPQVHLRKPCYDFYFL